MLEVVVIDPGLSDNTGKIAKDHFAVTFNASAAKPPPVKKNVSYRKLRSIDVESFKSDILTSEVFKLPECRDVENLVSVYNNELSVLIDKHAPLRSKTITLRPSCPWFTEELHDAKHLKRKLERKWQSTRLTIDHSVYRNQCAIVNKTLKKARIDYYSEKVESSERDQKSLFKITKHLLDGPSEVALPSDKKPKELVQGFSDFFIYKVETIINGIASQDQCQSTNIGSEYL